MKLQKQLVKKLIVSSTLAGVLALGIPSLANATSNSLTAANGSTGSSSASTTDSNSTSGSNTNSSSTLSAATQQQHLTTIKAKGDAEIARRLSQLNKLGSLITAAKHLTSTDQTSLSNEVNTEISGLTALETQLNSDTTLSTGITDAKNIITEYRVYLLVTPKVWLVKTADDQQVVESKLSTLATKLQTRITTEKTAGTDVTTLQSDLKDMTTQISSAQTISSSIETTVLPLTPSDYNSSPTILSGDATKLQTAHTDDSAAYTAAKNIVSQLKS